MYKRISKIVSFRFDEFMINRLNNESEKRKISRNEIVCNAVYEYIENHIELKGYEKDFVDAMLKESKVNMIEFVRSRNIKKITLIHNIQKMIYNVSRNQNWIEKKDLIENLNYTLAICDIYEWKKEKRDIQSMVKDLKTRMINEKKMGIKVTENKKIGMEGENE